MELILLLLLLIFDGRLLMKLILVLLQQAINFTLEFQPHSGRECVGDLLHEVSKSVPFGVAEVTSQPSRVCSTAVSAVQQCCS